MNIYEIKRNLETKDIKRIILDTDTYNEVDDQFALAYAVMHPQINLLSINAAPFFNDRALSPCDGMEKSYKEIENILELMNLSGRYPIYKGSDRFLAGERVPVDSPAARNIIRIAQEAEELVYVVAIGAITNVASALMLAPEIKEKIAVVWLGGNSLLRDSPEFNMAQDVMAAKVVLESGVPFVQLPASGVVSALATTIPELEYYLAGKNKLCDYLVDIVRRYPVDPYAYSKPIWDVAAVAFMTTPEGFDRVLIPKPVLTIEGRYSFDAGQEHMIYVRALDRDRIFAELFRLLSAFK